MHDLKEILIEGLDNYIRQSIRGYWYARKSASTHDFVFLANRYLSCNAADKSHYTAKSV